MPVTNVRSEWVDGNLVFRDKSGDEIFTIDGNARKLTFPSGAELELQSGALADIVAAADLALAEGSVLVGNSSGAAAALNAKTSGRILVGNGTTITSVAVSGGATLASSGALTLAVPKIGVLTETHAATTFTDGTAAIGTKTMTGTIPAGAVVLGSKVLVPAGFAGDVSAALTIGDGSDVDRYNTSTINVFTTAATGVQSGVPSGSALQVAAVSPVLTVTSNADITPVIAGAGSVTVSIYYIQTV